VPTATSPLAADAGLPDAAATGAAFREALARAERRDRPFTHWLLDRVLPPATAEALRTLPVEPAPAMRFEQGRREENNADRVYFDAATQARFPACAAVAEALQAPGTVSAIEAACGIDLTGASLRIEYTMDRDGFWLEPHTDIAVKRFTMLVYLSTEDWAAPLGTDLYDAEGNHVGSAPFAHNSGLIFIPAADTWHGLERRPIPGVRRSLIVNYVAPDWRARDELAFPDAPVAA
jgi:hypothetical protein